MTDNRDAVVQRYSDLARLVAGGGRAVDRQITGCGLDAYGPHATDLGVPEDALRASLACGNPVAVADLRPGDAVLDLGSGGGLDVLLAARRVGSAGRVYGIDASIEMLALARRHAAQAGVDNVEFLHGDLGDIPLPDAAIDVVISNCVINLATDKPRALAEAARVLRPGGRLGISDVLADSGLDPRCRAAAEHLVGCSVGTLTEPEYQEQLRAAGFTAVTITPTHPLTGGLYSAIVHARTPAAAGHAA